MRVCERPDTSTEDLSDSDPLAALIRLLAEIAVERHVAEEVPTPSNDPQPEAERTRCRS